MNLKNTFSYKSPQENSNPSKLYEFWSKYNFFIVLIIGILLGQLFPDWTIQKNDKLTSQQEIKNLKEEISKLEIRLQECETL